MSIDNHPESNFASTSASTQAVLESLNQVSGNQASGNLTTGNGAPVASEEAIESILATAPPEPQSLAEAGLSDPEVEAFVLKTLIQRGNCTCAELSDIICLARNIVLKTLESLRDALLVVIKGSAGMNDYLYQLSDAGHQRATRHMEHCRFVGPAPVPLEEYNELVQRQSIQKEELNLTQLREALRGLVLQPTMISQIAQALADGRGMFLYGCPGNGKTSLAERVCDAFGKYVWIPQMLTIGGEMVRLLDPSCHQREGIDQLRHSKYDRRWVLIRRPTIVVGGELTMDQLEMQFIKTSGISEAPVHLKSNCGTLVIDDFGRQRISSTEILNRLIVPMEKQFDFLHLPSGRQIRTPFDQLLIFSTNLEPRDLVDEAFLRRIPYKIEVFDPTPTEFVQLINFHAEELGVDLASGAADYLIEAHYKQKGRPFRFCHPRDLLRQVKNYCEVHNLPKMLNKDSCDVAIRNYFAGL